MKKQLLNTMIGLLTLGTATQLSAQVTLVETPGIESQDIGRVTAVGSSLYFIGREQGGSATDYYLWSNNGTSSTKIKLMSQVSQGINPSYYFPCNGKALFFYSDGVSASGYEPWITDGTTAGTIMIKDINPGSANSVFSNGLHAAFTYNNKAYFTANDGVNGDELWVTDGTAAGTMIVKDIAPGSNGSGITTTDIVLYKGEMYFTAKSGTYMELWHSDGTAAGTLKVNNPSTLRSYATALILNDTCLYFGGNLVGSGDLSVWKTNGTTIGTTVLTGSIPITPLNGFDSFTSNGTDVFFGYQFIQSFAYQHRLYKVSGGNSYAMIKDSLLCKTPVKLGSKIIFKGEYTGSATGGEPWVSDGTTLGTFKLNPTSWSTAGSFRNISPAFNNKIYFSSGSQLWETDGTIPGTVVKATMGGAGIWDFATMGSNLYFNGQNSANGNRQELFKLGGTSGINEKDVFAAGIVIYPQPAKETVMFNFNTDVKEVEISLFDITGKELKKESLNVYDNKTQLSVNDIAEGMYLVKFTTSDGRSGTGRMVIVK